MANFDTSYWTPVHIPYLDAFLTDYASVLDEILTDLTDFQVATTEADTILATSTWIETKAGGRDDFRIKFTGDFSGNSISSVTGVIERIDIFVHYNWEWVGFIDDVNIDFQSALPVLQGDSTPIFDGGLKETYSTFAQNFFRGSNNFKSGDDGSTLVGGDQRDTLTGGEGDDVLIGNGRSDYLIGGAGKDKLSGGDGHDTLIGQNQDDLIFGQRGIDKIFGGYGDDTIFGGGGNDVLATGYGQDLLFGNKGRDALFGRGGNDTLEGGLGNDTLVGGQGQDTFVFHFRKSGLHEKDVIRDLSPDDDQIDVHVLNEALLRVEFKIAGANAKSAKALFYIDGDTSARPDYKIVARATTVAELEDTILIF